MLLAEVTVPVGEYGTAVAAYIEPTVVSIVTALAAYAFRELPGWAVSLAREYVTQKRIERAVHWGVTQIDHEMIDPTTGQYRTVSVDTGNALADLALRYAMTYTPAMAAQLGERLKPRILAEIAKIGMAPAGKLPSPLPAAPLPQLSK